MNKIERFATLGEAAVWVTAALIVGFCIWQAFTGPSLGSELAHRAIDAGIFG